MIGQGILTIACLLLAPSCAFAADGLGGFLGGAWKDGPLAVIAAILIVVVAAGILISVGTSIAGVENRSFVRSIKAAGLAWILSLVVMVLAGFVCGLAGVESGVGKTAAGLVAAVVPGTLAIRSVYECGIAKALWAWIIASMLTVFLFFGLIYALGKLPA